MGRMTLLTVAKPVGGLLKLCLPKQAPRRGKTQDKRSVFSCRFTLGTALQKAVAGGKQSGFGGINSSTVTESYSLLGILR